MRFADVTQSAGIDFRHTSGQSGRKFIVETVGSGTAFLDYDGDGSLDLYVVNGADLPGHTSSNPPQNALYRNGGNGTFTDVAAAAGVADETYGLGCVVGDYDNDGDSDLFVANYGRNKLYRNGGGGGRATVFTDVAATTVVGAGAALSTGAAFADYDRDGDLDLFVATYLRYEPEDDALDESGRLARPRRYLAPTEYPGGRNFLFRNDGDDQFSDVTRSAGLYTTKGRSLGAVFFDYDNDGDVDLFQANDATPNFLYRNVGGRFGEIGLATGVAYGDGGVPEGSMGIDVDDVDGDGDADIVVTNFQWESNRLYANSGSGHFRDTSRKAGLHGTSLERLAFGINLFDADNDGDQDLFVANGHIDDDIERFDPSASYGQQDQIYLNDGSGRFADVSSRAGDYFGERRVGRGSAVGDYDNDGDGDLFISNSNDRAVLLRNESPSQNNWLALRLRGVRSNRDGVGARVDVMAGSLRQSTQVRTATSYLSQDDPRLYFGLGRRSHVDTVRVRWPSGIVQELHDSGVNEILVVDEPDIEPPQPPLNAEEGAVAAASEPTVRLMHLLTWAPLNVPGQKTSATKGQILPPSAEVIDSLKAIVETGDPSAAAHRELGEALRLNLRAKEARSQFLAALDLDGKHAPSYISLGKLELTMGRAAEAAQQFQKAAALVPGDGKPLSLLGYLAVRSQAFDRAIEFYEGALRRDASPVRVYANLARAYERQANPAEAVLTLRRGLKVAPRDIDMRLYLADIYLSRGQHDLAEEQLETILDIDPGRTEAIIMMSTVHRLQGDIEEAIELLETVEGDSTDVAIQRQLGLLLLDSGESEKVITYLEAAMSHDADEPEVCYALARAYRDHGDVASAQLMLKYFAHLRDHYKEIIAHRSALSLNRSDSQAFFELGTVYTHLGRLEAARQSFAYCLRMRPDHIDALNEIGGIYLRRRDLHQAIVTLGEVVSRDSTYAKGWESLGSALMLSGDQDRAQPALERAVQLDPTVADPHIALAQIYKMKGRDDEAKQHIETYRRLAANSRQSEKGGHHHSRVEEAGSRPRGR